MRLKSEIAADLDREARIIEAKAAELDDAGRHREAAELHERAAARWELAAKLFPNQWLHD